GLAGAGLDLGVGVDERPGRALGQQRAHRRLARGHEADERDRGEPYAGRHGMRARNAAYAARTSSTWSPPSFSRTPRPSSNGWPASTASAPTAAAAMAVVSERPTSASAGAGVSSRAERSGRISVGSGFIARRTTIVSPLDMPPSMPPARFVARW